MIKNKLNIVKMNKFKIFGFVLLASVSISNAQDLNPAIKAIDAEQFASAKSMLKSIIQAKPDNGKACFLLGNVFFQEAVKDSAKLYFQKGLLGAEGQNLNYIGLGQLDLDNGNVADAQIKFDLATKKIRKKDTQEYVYIGRAFMNIEKPDYKNALVFLNKAKLVNPMDAQVQLALGDAFYGDRNQNEAYAAYRDAFQADNTLIRAKMQLGVLLKGAKTYDLALKAYNEVIDLNPNYGPVYRELAETYYKWGRNKPSKSEEYMKTAIGFYEKYLSLTDYSLSSRMRHADFLILVKDYAALEIEAQKMIEMDKVNPRIYRYLGYSAFENGNIDLAIKSLENFVSNPTNKIIAKDYLYLGLSKIKKGTSLDGLTIDAIAFDLGIADIKKSIEMEPLAVEDLNEIGKKLFSQKFYKESALIFELGTLNAESKNYVDDNIYYGLSIYYSNNKKDVKPDVVALQKAVNAFLNVINASPTYQDAYLYSARTNSLMGNDEMTIKYYDTYISKVSEKGPEELVKPAVVKKIIESYNTIGASYANTDKVKAKEYFEKTLVIDATNAYAIQSLNLLK
jgi:tetratricopeptide (TPR) repeat protein